MKRTISLAALAVSVSASSSFAFVSGADPSDFETKTYCLDVYRYADGSMSAGGCDESVNNAERNLAIGESGCAEDQIALSTHKSRGATKFPIKINPCMPPNVAQL